MSKVLTIIIPAYNMEKHLERCLSSLLVDEGLMKLLEVLVINDGSTDNSSVIAHVFERRFPDIIRVIDKENGHYGSCINRGLEEARGTYIKVLDADDAFDTNVFGEYLSFLKDSTVNDCDLALSGYVEVDDSGNPVIDHPFSQYDGLTTIRDVSEQDIFEWFIHALTYKTSLLRDIHYRQTEKISYTDLEWAFVPMSAVKRIRKFPGNLYLYSTGLAGQSMAPSNHAKNLGMEAQVISKLLVFFDTAKPSLASDNFSFLKKRLVILINHLYQLYLLTYRSLNPDLKALLDFDRLLRETDADLYKETDTYVTTIAKLRFKPIHNWRYQRTGLVFLQSSLYSITDRFSSIFSRFKAS